MFDGAMAGDAVDAVDAAAPEEDASLQNITVNDQEHLEKESSRNEVVIVDGSITDYQSIISSIGSAAEVFILGENSTIDDVANLLGDRSGIDAIHIFTHGSAGKLLIGDQLYDENNISGFFLNFPSCITSGFFSRNYRFVWFCCFPMRDGVSVDVGVEFFMCGSCFVSEWRRFFSIFFTGAPGFHPKVNRNLSWGAFQQSNAWVVRVLRKWNSVKNGGEISVLERRCKKSQTSPPTPSTTS